ncbi:MAG: hypothetical protein HN560_16270 [Anaerolineae bacterium]|nr:hypothetical protein [Anaerolineae bacterium]
MMFFLALREPRIHKKQAFFIAFLIAVSAFLFQISLQSIMRPYAKDSFYFQEWSSEAMIQTVSLKDLQRNPLETLNNIHTKPPGFDAIRAILVHLWPAQDALGALLHVDFLLYKLWTVLYSILGAIAFLWLSQLTEIKVALIATFILLLHPATLLYSTLLDSNFLTTFLVFVFCYLMWKIKNEYRVHLFIVVLATLALFFTRAIFQYPFIIVVGSSLFLLRIQKRKVLVFLLITASIVGLYGAKQYHKFGILSASSFTGVNLNRSVGNPNFINYWTLDIDFQEQDSSLPKTLTRIKKVDGSPNFNHIQYLAYNQELIEDFKEYIFATPVSKITISYWENVQIYFEPSSQYNTEHAIIDRIPWKGFYDRIFSTPVFPGLLLVFGIPWLKKVVKEKDYLASIGLVLPGLYIFFITVLFEKGENMRFKFFLEPILFIFLVSQLYDLGKNIRAKLSTKST